MAQGVEAAVCAVCVCMLGLIDQRAANLGLRVRGAFYTATCCVSSGGQLRSVSGGPSYQRTRIDHIDLESYHMNVMEQTSYVIHLTSLNYI